MVDALREMQDEFGVVPMPKLNEEQEIYCVLVHDPAVVTAAAIQE